MRCELDDKKPGQTTLSFLTEKFILLLNSSPNRTVNLDFASKFLDVQRRRIYDITNVLEGVGMISRRPECCVQSIFPGQNAFLKQDEEILNNEEIKQEMEELLLKEKEIDEAILSINENMKEFLSDTYNRDFLYISYKELSSIPMFIDETMFGIKAPHGTTMDFPREVKKEDGFFEINLQSVDGPIDVFLINSPDSTSKKKDLFEGFKEKTENIIESKFNLSDDFDFSIDDVSNPNDGCLKDEKKFLIDKKFDDYLSQDKGTDDFYEFPEMFNESDVSSYKKEN